MNVMNHLKTDAETKGESDEDYEPGESGEQPAAQADPVLSFFCWARGGDHLDHGDDDDGGGAVGDGDDQGNLDDRQIPSSPSSAEQEVVIILILILVVIVMVMVIVMMVMIWVILMTDRSRPLWCICFGYFVANLRTF